MGSNMLATAHSSLDHRGQGVVHSVKSRERVIHATYTHLQTPGPDDVGYIS